MAVVATVCSGCGSETESAEPLIALSLCLIVLSGIDTLLAALAVARKSSAELKGQTPVL